jgi:glycosyltransferase involved in cell wall biosynthesis
MGKTFPTQPKTMKISFVIPAFNEERSIGKAVESIINEIAAEKADAEIIVVDNNSTDRTAEIAASFPNVKVLHESLKSAVKARDTGYREAHGDLIANIDADSRLKSGWISYALQEFAKDQKLVGLSGPYIFDDVTPKISRYIKIYYRITFISYFLNRFIFQVGSVTLGGNVIMRKSALDKLNGYNLDFTFYGDDTDLACRLYALGKVKFTNKLLVYSSGRRLMKEGMFKAGWRYALNFLWATWFHRPYTKQSIDIRM